MTHSLLEGLALDRAIASEQPTYPYYEERIPQMEYPSLKLCLTEIWYYNAFGEPARIWSPHTDPALALWLLEEMLKVGNGKLDASLAGFAFYKVINHPDGFREEQLMLQHSDFCAAIGNAYLQWKRESHA